MQIQKQIQKKQWSKPIVREIPVSEKSDAALGISRAQRSAAVELRRKAIFGRSAVGR